VPRRSVVHDQVSDQRQDPKQRTTYVSDAVVGNVELDESLRAREAQREVEQPGVAQHVALERERLDGAGWDAHELRQLDGTRLPDAAVVQVQVLRPDIPPW